MVWFWSLLIFFYIVFLATSLWLGYVKAVNKVGREAARRNIRHKIPVLVLIALSPVIPFLGSYTWVSLSIYMCLLFYFNK
jgi:hypothetical protein